MTPPDLRRAPATQPPTWAVLAEIVAVLICVHAPPGLGPRVGLPVASLLIVVLAWQAGLAPRDFGFARGRLAWRSVLSGVALGASVALIAWLALIPAAQRIAGAPLDTSTLRAAVATPTGLFQMLGQSWTFAAFGEEVCFRIYPLTRIASHPRPARVAVFALAIVSFGVAHAYQGIAGMLLSGSVGIILAIAYLASKRNAWLVVIAHGTVDSIAFVLFHAGATL